MLTIGLADEFDETIARYRWDMYSFVGGASWSQAPRNLVNWELAQLGTFCLMVIEVIHLYILLIMQVGPEASNINQSP